MTSKENQPATPLPWIYDAERQPATPICTADRREWIASPFRRVGEEQDARYIAHAANAYPRLVEALRGIIQSYDANNGASLANAVNAACDTLAELGEAE